MTRNARRDGLEDAIERRRGRVETWQREGERPLARNLALAGTLGWLVVVPALLGTFAGRFLDRRLGTHVTFTAALMFLGVAVGGRLVWRKIHSA